MGMCALLACVCFMCNCDTMIRVLQGNDRLLNAWTCRSNGFQVRYISYTHPGPLHPLHASRSNGIQVPTVRGRFNMCAALPLLSLLSRQRADSGPALYHARDAGERAGTLTRCRPGPQPRSRAAAPGTVQL